MDSIDVPKPPDETPKPISRILRPRKQKDKSIFEPEEEPIKTTLVGQKRLAHEMKESKIQQVDKLMNNND